VVQYAVLHYDNLGQRPHSTLGMYMTFSGLTMLVIGVAVARVLFSNCNRKWPALVLPALAVALTLTFTRSAWIGACAGLALLLVLKDFRLLAVLPLLAAVFLTIAPLGVVQRFYSILDPHDPTNRDRFAMLRAGERMVRDRPLLGVGPSMVERFYPEYRDEGAVEPIAVHLHNVPVQIASERGLPALAIWASFIGLLVVDLTQRFRPGPNQYLVASALSAVVSMLAAGMFEYNFGDSEFLILFLVVITLPFAALRKAPAAKVPV
jgi:O-antigen ligase